MNTCETSVSMQRFLFQQVVPVKAPADSDQFWGNLGALIETKLAFLLITRATRIRKASWNRDIPAPATERALNFAANLGLNLFTRTESPHS